jgi:NADPH-dependent 2,4-dienoyl-CoA reductase/sulfur reductase-like enzyme
LAKDGKRVTMIDMLDYMTLAADWPRGLSYQLEEYGVRFMTETKLDEITDQGVVVIDSKWKRSAIPADTVVLSLGFTPRTAVAERFEGLAADVYRIGDCVKPLSIKEAIHGAFNVAVEI